MRTRGTLTCRHRPPPPSRTAIETIARIQQGLDRGFSREELAQARAELAVVEPPRQGALALQVRR